MKISIMHLSAQLLKEYLRRRENQKLLARLKKTYADELDEAEKLYQQRVRRSHRRLLEREW